MKYLLITLVFSFAGCSYYDNDSIDTRKALSERDEKIRDLKFEVDRLNRRIEFVFYRDSFLIRNIQDIMVLNGDAKRNKKP